MNRTAKTCTRDVIVIGASAGGVEALRRLMAALPADLPAALFIVVHRGIGLPTYLSEILDAAGPLQAVTAEEGMPFQKGRIHVAPPDRHLLVGQDHVHVRRGPKENRVRPAIDPLFRSAAAHCSTRVIGMVLTGMLDDGTAGLLAIKRCGGVTVAQDPEDAEYPGMPRSAIVNGAADHVPRLDGIAALLRKLTAKPCPPPVEIPAAIRIEALIAAQELSMHPDQGSYGKLSPLTCPECHGAMYEIHDGTLLRFRCHTGHAFTAESLSGAQAEAWEHALYEALRTQEEQMTLTRRIAADARRRGSLRHAEDFDRRARGYEEGAEIIRRMLAATNGGRDAASRGDGEAAVLE